MTEHPLSHKVILRGPSYMIGMNAVVIKVLLYRGSSKMDEACDLYVRAANMYKMAKNWCGKNYFFSPLS